ncbi:MAG: hypothetical protein RLZZ621_1655 [Gemmatimonadota bacterium]|jgi:nitrite reductase/ring-hydroxylating ferredoxin subunit
MADVSPSSCSGCTARRSFLRDSVAALGLLAAGSLLPIGSIAALEPRGAGRTLRYPLPGADGVSIDSANEVIICRSAGEVFAFALSCPHQNTALKALPKNAGFQCTRHKSKYKPNGTFVSGRATRNMDRMQVTRDGEVLVVDPAVIFESDTEPAKWAAAALRV